MEVKCDCMMTVMLDIWKVPGLYMGDRGDRVEAQGIGTLDICRVHWAATALGPHRNDQ